MKLKDIFPYWTEIRPVLAEAVAPLGPEELGWRPPGGPNAVGDLAWHILEVEERDCPCPSAAKAGPDVVRTCSLAPDQPGLQDRSFAPEEADPAAASCWLAVSISARRRVLNQP